MSEASAAAIADHVVAHHLNQPFGIIQIWGFGLVQPNDQSYVLVSVHADADRLDLVFVHESRRGLPGVISVWRPEGLSPAEPGCLQIRGAARVRLDQSEGAPEDGQLHLRLPRGEGRVPMPDRPALLLSR